MSEALTENIDLIHTTELGAERIRRNLGLTGVDVTAWCRSMILKPYAVIERRGKNWYVRADGCEITVNAGSYTVITAHRIRETKDDLPEEPGFIKREERLMDIHQFWKDILSQNRDALTEYF